MPVDVLYFDTSYLVRLYLEDLGFESVRELAGSRHGLTAAWHAQAEVVAALHRAFRGRRMAQSAFRAAVEQFVRDTRGGVFQWLPLDGRVQQRVERVLLDASASVFLRAADALHLACAAENGFREVYSNDRHFLAAAPLFGLQGINVIAGG
jgi:predicted nucleic acid-binding protein